MPHYLPDQAAHVDFDRLKAYDTDWMTVLTVLEDRQYLNQPYVTSTHFKREADASKWMPSPCEAGGQ